MLATYSFHMPKKKKKIFLEENKPSLGEKMQQLAVFKSLQRRSDLHKDTVKTKEKQLHMGLLICT